MRSSERHLQSESGLQVIVLRPGECHDHWR
jgi:hypothetical protein